MYGTEPFSMAETRECVQRASRVCALLGLASVLLGVAYGAYHSMPRSVQLLYAHVSPTATQLANGFIVAAVLMVLWAAALDQATRRGVATRLLSSALKPRRIRPSFTWTAAVVAALGYAALRVATNQTTDQATFEDLAHGTASLPFQYRALAPLLVSGVRSVLPSISHEAAFGAVDALSALAVYASFRLLLSLFFRKEDRRDVFALGVFIPLMLNLAFPYRYNALFFPWDTPSVALFTLGLYLLHTKKWGWYYVVFAAATLNRETSCFLTLCYALAYFREDGLPRVSIHVAAQAAIWLTIKTILYWAYLGNPLLDPAGSGFFFYQVERSIRILTSPVGLLYLITALGGTWVVLALLQRFIDEPILRRSFYFVPVFLAGMFVVGEMMEVRIYSELIPLVTAGLLVAARRVLVSLAQTPDQITVQAVPHQFALAA